MAYRIDKKIHVFALAVALAVHVVVLRAQAGDPATLIKDRLMSRIKLTKTTDKRDDIVVAGDVVVLHKDGLMMCSSESSYSDSNTYRNGVLIADQKERGKSAAQKAGAIMFRKLVPGADDGSSIIDSLKNGCTERKFVAGEKFWVTSFRVEKSGILLSTFSDPYNGVRYYGQIDFQFPKGRVPTVEEFVKTVSEVITVQPVEPSAAGNGTDQASKPAGQDSTAAVDSVSPSMPPIVPPPPPQDAPRR